MSSEFSAGINFYCAASSYRSLDGAIKEQSNSNENLVKQFNPTHIQTSESENNYLYMYDTNLITFICLSRSRSYSIPAKTSQNRPRSIYSVLYITLS